LSTGFEKGIFMWRNLSRGRWGNIRSAGASALAAGLAGLLLASSPGLVHARGPLSGGPVETITSHQLPPQGQDMMALIYQGGPFRHDKDGVVFGNRERILPASPRGYYREYTVRTPNERSRGARRIVCGGAKPVAPDACYYTDDHYASFRKIVQ
jgi:ribonuclease T1